MRCPRGGRARAASAGRRRQRVRSSLPLLPRALARSVGPPYLVGTLADAALLLLPADAALGVERHPAPTVAAPKASMWPSIAVRSSRLAPVKSGIAAKVSLALAETGISTQLVMPTKANLAKLDDLHSALGQMVELKKAVDRIQGEIRLVKKRRAALRGESEDPATSIKAEDDDGDKSAAARVRSLSPPRPRWARSTSRSRANSLMLLAVPAEQAQRVGRVVDRVDQAGAALSGTREGVGRGGAACSSSLRACTALLHMSPQRS